MDRNRQAPLKTVADPIFTWDVSARTTHLRRRAYELSAGECFRLNEHLVLQESKPKLSTAKSGPTSRIDEIRKQIAAQQAAIQNKLAQVKHSHELQG